jgi:hypothetical protein
MYDMRHPSGERLRAESCAAWYKRPTEAMEIRAKKMDNDCLAIARAGNAANLIEGCGTIATGGSHPLIIIIMYPTPPTTTTHLIATDESTVKFNYSAKV